MENLQNHIRNYKLVERKCEDLFEFLLVDDQKLSLTTSGNLLVQIVQCIESLAKDLHKELAPQFRNLPKFHAGERFDYDALGFLDQALGLSKKQIKITSKLMPYLSEERRLITPLLGAHESTDKHPLWSKAYQSNKHDFANSQNADLSASSLGGKASIPSTIQAEIEAAGAAFILLTVAKNLPLNKEKPYDQCDFTFDSNIFTATYTRPLFSRFLGPMSKDCLQFFPNWEQKLFVVKDPDRYIAHLRAKIEENNQQIKDAILSNSDFVSFFNNLTEDLKRNPIEPILMLYEQETKDPVQKEWIHRIQDLSFSIRTSYYIGWANNYSDHLRLSGFAPVVTLSQDTTDSK